MQEMSDAAARWARGTGAEFFGTLNALVEAAVRAGCASPGLLPTGMVLLATVLEGCLFVGTARGARSQWLRNRRAEPRVRYWLAGREHGGAAFLFAEGPPRPATQMLPPLARAVAEGLLPAATACGWQFAVIRPERAGCGSAPGAASGAAD